MPSKRLMLLLAALAALLTTSPALANTYTVHSCKTPAGTWVGADGWVANVATTTTDRDGGSVQSCSPSAPMGATFGGPQLPANGGVGRSWKFEAAANTTIRELRLDRTFDIGWLLVDSLYDRPFVADVWHDLDEAANRVEFRAPPWGGSLDSSGGGTAVVASGTGWNSVNARLRCWEEIGDLQCGPYRASLLIARASLGIEDSLPPTGALTEGAVAALAAGVRGNVGVGFGASDLGGGVYRAIVSVDGSEVRREIVDGGAGSCRDVEPSNADAYEFATPRPCPLNVDGTVAVDTRGLADGQHQVKLEVEDAAGNRGLVHQATVTTHNAPVLTVAPQLAGDARVGGELTTTSGHWDGAPTAVELRWLRCAAGGDSCTAIAGAAGPLYRPTATDAGHRLVAEAVAENASGAASGRSAASAVVTADGTGAGDGTGREGTPGSGTPGAGVAGGLENPVAGQGGHTANGDGATGQTRLTIRLRLAGGGSAERVRARHTRRWTLTGQLVGGDGRGIAGARLNVVSRVTGRAWRAGGVVETGADGRFSHLLPAGPSRQVRVAYFPYADSRSFRSSNVVAIDALAPLTIRADRRRLAGRQAVTLTGRASGARIPSGGLLVTLQGYQRGWGWRTFRTLRTTRSGTWRARYRFRSASGRFAFRAVLPRQHGFPFVTTTSAAVAVTVG